MQREYNTFIQRKEKSIMKTEINRIAAKAIKNRKEVFTSLAHHITLELLWDSLRKIPLQSSVGVDNQDVKRAKEEFSIWSVEIISALHRRRYRPPPLRRTYIPKIGKAQKRPISIPTIVDRVLQKAVVEVLNAIYEKDFLDCSFGGRPKRSAHQALATLHKAIIARKVSWIYEADLKNFFGSLDQEWIERFVTHRIQDPRILTLIKRWLKAGVLEEGEIQQTPQGIPQGGPISVLLSNIYLHYVLDLWIEKVMKPKMRGEVYYVRYLDDFVVCFQYHSDALLLQQEISKRLGKFSLELEASKTRLIEFGRFADRDAKAKREKVKVLYFLGFQLYCSKSHNGNFKIGVKTEKTRLRTIHLKITTLLRKIRHRPLCEQEKAINSVLRGHYQYYGVVGNFNTLYCLYRFTERYWHKALSSRSQKGYLNWIKYRKILEKFPLKKPSLSMPYSRMNQLAKL